VGIQKTKIKNQLKAKIDIPEKPGVYLFKSGDNILYIGKAKNLKKRVEQYFQKSEQGMIRNLLQRADDIEFIVTDDEKDALHLEYNLIHQYFPPFNIRLKDDKSFPLIEITTCDSFPGIYYTRQIKGKNLYVGPIVDARRTKELIDMVTRIFKLRTCPDTTFKRQTACLYYYIDRCSAPCTESINEEEYRKNVSDAIDFLKGNKNKIVRKLEKKMEQLAEKLKFEEAQKVKEDIRLIHQFTLESYISTIKKIDYDVIALHHDPDQNDCFVILFSILEGRVKRKEFFNFNTISTQIQEILKDFLVSLYRSKNIPRIPKEILVRDLPNDPDKDALESMFSQIAGHQVKIKLPIKGQKRKMMDMAVKNLNLYVNKHKYSLVGERLKQTLHLAHFPHKIEGFDISHFSERDRVGAAVVFSNGVPDKKKYRNYIIKNAAAGDTEALKEVLERRFKNRQPEEQPDLLLIDGGKGQLSAAASVKEKLNLRCDIAALAKREERIYLEDGGSVLFPEDSPERFLFQNIRDEVHRRAITHHRKRREKID
jgi:excinuclease ABC subunit C